VWGKEEIILESEAEQICRKVIGSNSAIRSASMCSESGEILCSEHRNDETSLTTRMGGQASLIQATVRFFNRRIHEKSFGKTIFSLTLHEKVARISIPFKEKYVILISADEEVNHSEMITKDIYKILGKFK
jgi:alpha-amylase/alpha-mannosidase (GH57 family)